jgi:hypothetical protein
MVSKVFQKLITLKFYKVVLVHVHANQFIHAKHTCTTHKTKGMLGKKLHIDQQKEI